MLESRAASAEETWEPTGSAGFLARAFVAFCCVSLWIWSSCVHLQKCLQLALVPPLGIAVEQDIPAAFDDHLLRTACDGAPRIS